MSAAKKVTAVVVAGLACAVTVGGTAGSATAAEKGEPANGVSARATAAGSAIKPNSAKAPHVERTSLTPARVAADRQTARAGTATTICYEYSNGRGDLCQWYLSGYRESRGGVYSYDDNLNDNLFQTSGYGQYEAMGNNTESAYNADYIYRYRVFSDPRFNGWFGPIIQRTGGDYNPRFLNNVESAHQF